jgi:carboxymethylenebutenolidase
MCDERTVKDNEKVLQQRGQVTRRQYTQLTGAAAMALLLPRAANAVEVSEADVIIDTPDGQADCHFVHPSSGAHPGVVVWPDALGLRPAFRAMGKRLAESGYSVLTVNQYYRSATAPIVEEGASFGDQAVRDKLMPLFQSMSPETNKTDALAFIAFLDGQDAVDTGRKIGTTGYCMGGAMTMRTAAAAPGRVGAGASFHGGSLVTDKPDSPHLLVASMKARYLFAIAANDDEREPDAKDVLRETYEKANLPAEIEVYEGAMHGWCPPDSAIYNEAQAERAWGRLLILFEEALA